MTDERFYPPRNFAALPPEYSDYERSRVVVLPVPYDSTASGWVGSREGPNAIIDASMIARGPSRAPTQPLAVESYGTGRTTTRLRA